jgi:deazaflavin-dependent oxidoreductase (nitroreductase family)
VVARLIARFTNRAARRRGLQVAWIRFHAALYRRTGGKLGRGWFGAPVLVLEVTGRRSGKLRAVPVIYTRLDGSPVVFAANAGAQRHPDWYLNLRDAGEATVVLRGRRTRVEPRTLEGEERDRAWKELCRVYPAAEHYLGFTERRFPVIALAPAA